MEEAERIRELKMLLCGSVPEHLFTIEQLVVVESLIANAVDATVDMICDLAFSGES